MNKMIRAAFFLLSIFLLSGCQKIIEPKNLPDQDPRLVLNSSIENGSLIELNVSSSKSIISGKDYKFLDNAKCLLYENDLVVDQFDNIKEGNYISHVLPKANNKYTIKVSASGYETAEGTTTVPDSTVFSGAERYDLLNSTYYAYSTAASGNVSVGGNTKCLLKIKDNVNIKNYYNLHPVILLYDSLNNLIREALNVYITNNTTNSSEDYYGEGEIEVDDANLVNGNDILLNLDIGMSDELSSIAYAEVYMIISGLSEELYKYNTTYKKQTYNGVSLFAEPVMVFNNIKNGMGIVGGTNSGLFFLYTVPVKKN